MPELAFVNGEFLPIDRATVSVEDRGFQFGDAVYEVLVAYAGRLFLPEEHLQRLRQSAAAIGLDYPFDQQPLLPVMQEGLRRCELRETMIYIQLTRGVAPRNIVIPQTIEPTTVMTFRPRPMVPEELRRRGLRVMTVRDTRWTNCYIKAVTLLPNMLARNDAIRQGHDDAVFVTADGHVRECTASNIFMIKEGRVRTPRRTHAILHGVTQMFVMRCADHLGLHVEECALSVAALRDADEVFLSNTTSEIMGITSVDDRPVASGHVGPLTRRLHEEFVRRARDTAKG